MGSCKSSVSGEKFLKMDAYQSNKVKGERTLTSRKVLGKVFFLLYFRLVFTLGSRGLEVMHLLTWSQHCLEHKKLGVCGTSWESAMRKVIAKSEATHPKHK